MARLGGGNWIFRPWTPLLSALSSGLVNRPQSHASVIILLLSCVIGGCHGAQQASFTDGDIAGAVIGSVLCTLLLCSLIAFAFYWFYIRKRDGRFEFEDATKPGYKVAMAPTAKVIHLQPDNIRKKEPAGYGYLNTGFRSSVIDDRALLCDGRQITRTERHDPVKNYAGRRRSREFDEATDKLKRRRSRSHQNLQRHHPGMQDGHGQVIRVKLRGHDFTGLGFNICGNLRDGIYVQNVLHKGPAADCGLLESGDRIVDVQVSFKNIVFEDALTILSYASPYDVTLYLQKEADTGRRPRQTNSDQTNRRSWHYDMSQTTLPNGFLKRSQSNGDLDQIHRTRRRSSSESSAQSQEDFEERPRYVYTRQAAPSQNINEVKQGRKSVLSVKHAGSLSSLKERSSPTSSIRHVMMATPSVSGNRSLGPEPTSHATRSQIPPTKSGSVKSSLHQTSNEVSEETVLFSQLQVKAAPSNSTRTKKAPPVPYPASITVNNRPSPTPRPFSSISETSGSSEREVTPLPNDDEQRESSMLEDIYRQMHREGQGPTVVQDGARSWSSPVDRSAGRKPAREYQTFEMVWTEGSESDRSSIYNDRSAEFNHGASRDPHQRLTGKDSGLPSDDSPAPVVNPYARSIPAVYYRSQQDAEKDSKTFKSGYP
ncbi:hypothetical protein RvY_03921 [Ramazzottius varieornatus]|uniref:PDZ domain-containing protein n=1 Tax=Ramazzottius varieornatus TaxID=947166 RepID=A0A1D1UPR5_RAMVA|nr:hypothetical protein RvY_03921 [Ramazzottius varieornatus]